MLKRTGGFVGGVGSPLMKTPGPSLVRARDSGLCCFLSSRFSGEAIPASTVAAFRAEGSMVLRIVCWFVMTRFRSKCLLGES
jgi:hypothetical protein